MALKMSMRPGESLFLGTNRLIVKSSQIVDFYLVGMIPVLREKYYLDPHPNYGPMESLYLLLQEAFLSGGSLTTEQVNIHLAEVHTQSFPSEARACLTKAIDFGSLVEGMKICRHFLRPMSAGHFRSPSLALSAGHRPAGNVRQTGPR